MSYQRFKKGGRVAKRQFLEKKVCKNSLIYIYNIYKIGLENFEMHDWGNYRVDFAFFGLIRTVPGLGLKNFSNFWSCIDLGHILKNRVLAPLLMLNFEGNIFFKFRKTAAHFQNK